MPQNSRGCTEKKATVTSVRPRMEIAAMKMQEWRQECCNTTPRTTYLYLSMTICSVNYCFLTCANVMCITNHLSHCVKVCFVGTRDNHRNKIIDIKVSQHYEHKHTIMYIHTLYTYTHGWQPCPHTYSL